jgi:hypothetical protein
MAATPHKLRKNLTYNNSDELSKLETYPVTHFFERSQATQGEATHDICKMIDANYDTEKNKSYARDFFLDILNSENTKSQSYERHYLPSYRE